MRLTHFWRRPRLLEPEETWNAFANDAARIFEHLTRHVRVASGRYKGSRISLAGPAGQGEPIVAAREISFNGVKGPCNLSHESCHVPRRRPVATWESHEQGLYLDFCKTARKPYDLAVAMVLFSLKHCWPEVELFSDGFPEDFAQARSEYVTLFPDRQVAVACTLSAGTTVDVASRYSRLN